MSENIFNKAFTNTQLNKPFGLNILPERTMQQVKETAANTLKDVIKPITDVGAGKEEVLDGTIAQKIASYNNIVNMIINTTAAADKNSQRTFDIKL